MAKRLRTSPHQAELMVAFMEQHGDLLKMSREANGKEKTVALWKELEGILNNDLTGDPRGHQLSKKVWADAKNNTKNKYNEIATSRNATGGGEGTTKTLSQLEDRILVFVNKQAALGIAGVNDAGMPMQYNDEIIVEVPITSNMSMPLTPESSTHPVAGPSSSYISMVPAASSVPSEMVFDYDCSGESVPSAMAEDTDDVITATPRPRTALPHVYYESKSSRTSGGRRLVHHTPKTVRTKTSIENHGEQLVGIEKAKMELKKHQLAIRSTELKLQERDVAAREKTAEILEAILQQTRETNKLLKILVNKTDSP